MSAYFDGDLSPDEQAGLRAWLLESSDHINQYVTDCFVHTQLIDLLNRHQVRANALVAAENVPGTGSAARSRRVVGRLIAIAISIACTLAFMFFYLSRPMVVATVTGIGSAKWAAGAEMRTVGALLRSGDEIALDSGTLHITFARGGQVALHGPGRFRVDSDASAQLFQGSLSAFVPEHAVGFTIRTKKVNIVDLGTEFRVDLVNDDSCELQVFSGLVEVQFRDNTNRTPAANKLQISQGRAIRVDGGSESVTAIEYNQSIRFPSSAWSR